MRQIAKNAGVTTGLCRVSQVLTYLSLLLSAVSAVIALFPFMFLFFIIREVIEVLPDYMQAAGTVRSGWMAVRSALLSVAVYFTALMCPHLPAFQIAGNIRKALMDYIAQFPMGFIFSSFLRELLR